jgi:hypothetical protein
MRVFAVQNEAQSRVLENTSHAAYNADGYGASQELPTPTPKEEDQDAMDWTALARSPDFSKYGLCPERNILTPLEIDIAANPRAFFKKGRVFMTAWVEPKDLSKDFSTERAQFAVVKPHPTFSVCLRISTYSGQATTKPGLIVRDHAAVVPLGGDFVPHPEGEHMEKEPIVVKVENESVTIDPMSRINFAKPYTIEHNVKILNVGRVVGESVGLVDKYFAESLGLTKG